MLHDSGPVGGSSDEFPVRLKIDHLQPGRETRCNENVAPIVENVATIKTSFRFYCYLTDAEILCWSKASKVDMCKKLHVLPVKPVRDKRTASRVNCGSKKGRSSGDMTSKTSHATLKR